jgi:translation initiation factor 5B
MKPGKIEVMEGYIFRRAKPAIFGARVLAGQITPNVNMINAQGEKLGRISQIQDSGQAISRADAGKEVAVAMPQPIVGRHIKEHDVLYVDIPERDAKLLRTKFAGRLTETELKALMELVEQKRKADILWAV